MSICTIYRDVVTVTKIGTLSLQNKYFSVFRSRYATSGHTLSIGLRFGEVSRRKTNSSVATV